MLRFKSDNSITLTQRPAFSRFIADKNSVILFITIQLKSGQVDIANQVAAFYFEK